ncbi:hypothetical protein D9757_002837 [Collybiopsis confluens]|uniref:Transmembrane protein n=1 Tax=Collybiopsis confluens TaxID=2823264 RepID=A0A8H5HVP7_9AGAR|nr:hypothetical protein D9757_002837 [Collybiopsis confluens]
MDQSTKFQNLASPQPGHSHSSKRSIDTQASGIADSTISFAGSLHLGRFPTPPLSIPESPITSPEHSPSIASGHTHRTFTTAPLVPLRKKTNATSVTSGSPSHRLLPSIKSNLSAGSSRNETEPVKSQPSSLRSRTISPFDWHEGASSIDVDDAEDRLLSTNFITSLLQQDPNQRVRRASMNSDAYSGFSEMTYPPVMRYPGPSEKSYPPSTAVAVPKGSLSVRPHGARPPPSSFNPIPEHSGHDISEDDSDTLASDGDFGTTVIRSASISHDRQLRGHSIVGVAPARLTSITSSSPTELRASLALSDDRTLSYGQFAQASSSFPHNSALPSSVMQLNFLRDPSRTNSAMQSRQSIHSTRSFVPSVISRISETGRSIARVLPWRRKPLPPVPTIPHIPIAQEAQNRLEESHAPLPELVARAEALNELLEKGYHPHHSLDSSYYGVLPKEDSHTSALVGNSTAVRDGESPLLRRRGDAPNIWDAQPTMQKSRVPNPRRKRYLVILAIFIVVAAASIGAGVGVKLGQKQTSSLPKCSSENITGTSCDLDATCVCTTSNSGCNGLAQSIITLTPTMNQLFDTNIPISLVYTAIWLAQGSSIGENCASQALLIDTPGLPEQDTPNRTSWARSAMLWNLVQSQDVTAVQSLQSFTKNAPWSNLHSDGPVSGQSSFSTAASGFTFDFAAQTVTQPAVSFAENGQPVNEQISRAGSVATAALDRMYSYAVASSTQHSNALQLYWTNVIDQKLSDLSSFRSAVISSSILIPFDATNNQVESQLSNSTSQMFPIPISCYPNLNEPQVQQIDAIEQNAFGLSAVGNATSFDSSCYPDRPLYGVLDVLRLRLPFIDSRTGLATQAVSLQTDVSPRAIVRCGEALSALPLSSNASAFTAAISNPRTFGTLNNFDSVLLDYLSAMPAEIASALASFLLSSTNGLPPPNTSSLGSSIALIPSIEVAVFGTVLPPDIKNVVSSFTSPTGSLFFGSAQGQSVRNFAINAAGSSVVWAQSALSTAVARDSSETDATFQDIWTNAALAITNNVTSVGVSNITNSLQSTGKLSS